MECIERNSPAIGRVESVIAFPARTVRHRERRLLREAVDSLELGRGQVVELTGDPGTGKTRLVAELLGYAQRRGVQVAHVRSTEYERQVPYRSLALLLEEQPLSGWRSHLSAEEHELIGKAVGARSGQAMSGTRSRCGQRVAGAMRTLLEQRIRHRTIIVLEDFHWADSESADLVDFLVRHPLAAPLLLIVVQRPRQTSPRFRGTLAHGLEMGTVTRIELAPLSLEQSAHFLGTTLQDPQLPDLHTASRGIPLYLAALADGTGEGGDATPCDHVPTQIADLLLGEIAALDPRDSLVAAAAAVLGDRCEAALLASVTELGEEDVDASIGSLLERDILRTGVNNSGLTVRHPILRKVIYNNALSSWRWTAHRNAIAALSGRGAPAGVLAEHVECAVSGADLGDLHILRQAAEDALLTDPERAAHWLEVAYRDFPEEALEPRIRAELLLLGSRVLAMSGRLPESRDLFHRTIAASAPEDGDVRASAVASCAVVECLLGHFAEARALLAEEIERATASPDPPRQTPILLIEHGLIGSFDGQMPTCDQVERAVRLARQHGDRLAESGAYVLKALCDAFNNLPRARTSLAVGAEAVDRLPDAEFAAHPEFLGMLGWAETLAGLYQDAERHFTRGVEIARKSGHSHMLPALMIGLGNIHRHIGHLEEARRTAVEARELADRINAEHVSGLALALEALATTWSSGEETKRAVELAERALHALRSRDFYWSVAGAVALATTACLDGDHNRCVTILIDAGRGPELSRLPPFIRAQCFAMVLAATLETGEPADDWAERAEEAAEGLELRTPCAYAFLARGVALRSRGDLLAAADRIQQAADLFAESGMSHAKAQMLLLAARCLIDYHCPRQATRLLVLAKELARRCGGGRVYEEAVRQEHIVAALPATPDAVGCNLSALTRREREIAGLAGDGLKTREIAARLSLSPRTVDVHLTRVYRKLNISSRAMLARVLVGSRPPGDR
ncbi:regulatory protein, luxR family [Sinosporangium album]|uniref:Regulatory protein, luxR family n=1 Tax=Sinosporangium album TaxID=504805 RepID=A0A1G7YF19_9ACTN|nr:regulatory protein, luxR family [Sinosporangium album]